MMSKKLPDPVGILKSDEFAGHIFEPSGDKWPFNEQLFTSEQMIEYAKRKPLTEDQVFWSERLMSLNGLTLKLPLSELMKIVKAVEELHDIKE